MPELDSKSIDFIRAVDENGGRATTSDIRDETGLSNSAVNYRYGKLDDMGLIDIKRDASLTADGVAPAKVAVLTSHAREEIDKGLLVEAKRQAASEPDVDANAERLDDLEEEVETIREVINEQISPAYQGWRMVVVQLAAAIDDSDIDVSLQDVAEMDVDDETVAFLARKAKENSKSE